MKCYSSTRENEILPGVTTWMDPEHTMLSEIKSDRERYILMTSLIYGSSKKESQIHKDREYNSDYQGLRAGGRGGRLLRKSAF